jgi:hypothetical protein
LLIELESSANGRWTAHKVPVPGVTYLSKFFSFMLTTPGAMGSPSKKDAYLTKVDEWKERFLVPTRQ